jgi:L-lactate dehydrogenase complex protein LldE
VYFFGTCLVDQFAPGAGLDAVRLLEREGIAVRFPEQQTCCGQPAYTSGYPDEARKVARLQLELFSEPLPIVVPSGSCAGMMRHHYPKLFVDDQVWGPRAREMAERVFELTEFLVNVVGYMPEDHGAPCIVAVHTSCSARREMGSHVSSEALVGGLANVKVVNQARKEECCGFGGTFAVAEEAMSVMMGKDRIADHARAGAEVITGTDVSCLMHMDGLARRSGQRVRFRHVAEVLAEAMP